MEGKGLERLARMPRVPRQRAAGAGEYQLTSGQAELTLGAGPAFGAPHLSSCCPGAVCGDTHQVLSNDCPALHADRESLVEKTCRWPERPEQAPATASGKLFFLARLALRGGVTFPHLCDPRGAEPALGPVLYTPGPCDWPGLGQQSSPRPPWRPP